MKLSTFLVDITMKLKLSVVIFSVLAIAYPEISFAVEPLSKTYPDIIGSNLAIAPLFIFIIAYIGVITEEYTNLSKSKPVMLAAVIIWALIALMVKKHGADAEIFEQALKHNLVEYASLLLFLLVAMTYINVMIDRNVFEALRSWLISKRFSYKKIFWITGFLAFFISPIADNLTTALLMGSVLLAVASENKNFIVLSFINVVVGANAGGAFSPFGDITTLMVWQSQKANFFSFFSLFVPSLVNFLVPAVLMSFSIPKGTPEAIELNIKLKPGALQVSLLFLCTISLAVMGERILHLPPYLGMMAGLSLLFFFSYFKNRNPEKNEFQNFSIFGKVAKAEWDTLLFFYGVIFCVGGLAFIGYLSVASEELYHQFGASVANIAVGVVSALIDNIPVMFAVITMNPDMDQFQWLLVALTAGVGGSLLSIGSAAGVALMGQSKFYSFAAHLKWSWAIALGYILSIWVHFLMG